MRVLGTSSNKSTGCTETATSCVTWDGPNISIDCLGVQIYKGESISPILHGSFKNLCILLEKINVNDLDLKCLLQISAEERSIKSLFNSIIDKLCIEDAKLKELENTIEETYSANLPYCLQDFNDQLTITKLELPEYYQKLALRICLYLTDLALLNQQVGSTSAIWAELDDLELQINTLCNTITEDVYPTCTDTTSAKFEIQNITNTIFTELLVTTSTPHGFSTGNFVNIYGVTPSYYNITNVQILVNSPTQFTVVGPNGAIPPYVSGGITLISNAMPVQVAYQLLEKSFCSLKNFTGTYEELNIAVNADCPNLGNLPRLSNSGTMSTIYGWQDYPGTVAQSMNNLWLTICDMRTAIRNVLGSCCSTSPCFSFDLGYTLNFDLNNTYVDIVFYDTDSGTAYCKIQDLARTVTYDGSIPVIPSWIAFDFPYVSNLLITLDDGSGPITIDTGNTLQYWMNVSNGGFYTLTYPVGYDPTAINKSITFSFNYYYNHDIVNATMLNNTITYTLADRNIYSINDYVDVYGVTSAIPGNLDVTNAKITAVTATTFTVTLSYNPDPAGTYISDGATIPHELDCATCECCCTFTLTNGI